VTEDGGLSPAAVREETSSPLLARYALALAARVLRRAPRSLYGQGDPGGYMPLRKAIAEYVGSSRGVRCTAPRTFRYLRGGAQKNRVTMQEFGLGELNDFLSLQSFRNEFIEALNSLDIYVESLKSDEFWRSLVQHYCEVMRPCTTL
jgi:hypothetical protein